MPVGVNTPMFLAGCVWPCLLACAAVYDWPIAVSLFSGIAMGWWARDLLGVLLGVSSAPAATTSSGSASSASPAGGFAGEYWDPQEKVHWEIKDARQVMAKCKEDGRTKSGWFEGSDLTIEFTSDKKFNAHIRGLELVWSNGAPPWTKK